jgi:Asp-tRNA(Asn)/Glu-tRNA(Gln) amidotransferase B subunit
MEIVSEPDMRSVFFPAISSLTALMVSIYNSSPEEAGEYVRTLQAMLRSVGSSDGNMEQVRVTCQLSDISLTDRL